MRNLKGKAPAGRGREVKATGVDSDHPIYRALFAQERPRTKVDSARFRQTGGVAIDLCAVDPREPNMATNRDQRI